MKFTKRIILIMLFFISTFMLGSFMKNSKVNAEGEAFEIVETGVKYETFVAAKSAATSGQTLKLLRDYEYTGSGANIDKNLTIDFADYTFTHNGTLTYFMSFSGGYTLTLKASGNGGIVATKTVIQFMNGYSPDARLNIQSGNYNSFGIRYEIDGSTISLATDGFVATSGLSGKINITGGKFYMPSTEARNTLSSFVNSRSFTTTETLGSGTNRQVLDVTPETYVTDENTQTSLNLSYTRGYSYYREVTSLSSSDAGKKYLIGYVNKSEDVIYLMKNYENASFHVMYADKHNNVNKTNDGTWYINSNSEFLGNPDEDFFVTLGYTGSAYTLSVKAGVTNRYLYFYKTDGSKFGPREDGSLEDSDYIHAFGFNTVNHYLYPQGTSKCLSYSPSGTYANYFSMTGDGVTHTSGIGNNYSVYARLFEKVDVDPVVNESSIRFGKAITKDMYDFLSGVGTSVSFGVIAKRTSALGGAELKVDNASMTRAITPVRVSAPGAAVEDLEGDYYQFALVIDGITETDFETSITARVYVCVDGEYYYMSARDFSVKTLAAAYFNAADTSAYTEHLNVLEYLKDYVG